MYQAEGVSSYMLMSHMNEIDKRYEKYTYERVYSCDDEYGQPYVEVEVTGRKFGVMPKLEKVKIPFYVTIIEREGRHTFETVQFLIEIAIDDKNKTIYWKSRQDIVEDLKRRNRVLEHEKATIERDIKRLFMENQRLREEHERLRRLYHQRQRGSEKQNKEENSYYRKSSTAEGKLREYLDFLNIRGKNYGKKSLKEHYRKLAKMYHPDARGDNGEMMAKINEAYDYIMSTLD